MLKRLFPFAASVSLGIGILAIALWMLSYDGHNSFIRTRYLPPDAGIIAAGFTPGAVRSSEVIAVVDGELICGWSRTATFNARPTSGWHLFTLPSRNLIGDESFLHRLGLDLTNQTTPQGKSRRLLVPMWAVVALTMILPAAWYVARTRQTPKREGLCTSCEYDLRGLEGSICPNCGAAAARPVARSTLEINTPKLSA